jgi:hypothetical protein
MHHFYKVLIEPILVVSQSKRIVEIGAWRGSNTLNLLEYCQQQKGFLEIIEPLPTFTNNQSLFQKKEFYTLHKDLSLNILPNLNPFDAVLIDGDHNWYTVFHELQCIEKTHLHEPSRFPIILMHDTCWPYARRDLYYNPETIPPEFRHKYRQAGIKPGQIALDDHFSFNSHLCNAVLEGGEKNGVLTAIEDYLNISAIEFEFIQIPFFHGLGILISKARLQRQKELHDFVQKLVSSENLISMMQEFEKHRAEDFAQTYHYNKSLTHEKDILTQKNKELSQKLDLMQNNTLIKLYTKIQKRLRGV